MVSVVSLSPLVRPSVRSLFDINRTPHPLPFLAPGNVRPFLVCAFAMVAGGGAGDRSFDSRGETRLHLRAREQPSVLAQARRWSVGRGERCMPSVRRVPPSRLGKGIKAGHGTARRCVSCVFSVRSSCLVLAELSRSIDRIFTVKRTLCGCCSASAAHSPAMPHLDRDGVNIYYTDRCVLASHAEPVAPDADLLTRTVSVCFAACLRVR